MTAVIVFQFRIVTGAPSSVPKRMRSRPSQRATSTSNGTLQQDGPAGAVTVCRDEAPRLTAAIGEKLGVP